MKKTVIILLTALLTIPFTDASAQILKKRQSLCHRHHSIKTRNEDHTPEYKY